MILKLSGALLGSLLFSSLVLGQQPQVKVAPMKSTPPMVQGQPNTGLVVKADAATIEKGRKLYMANCLQCHNKDPNVKGSIGPEQVDAPYEVVYSKIMTGKYPEKLPQGYVPKRKSRAMRAIPKLKNDIPAIYAWLQSQKKKK